MSTRKNNITLTISCLFLCLFIFSQCKRGDKDRHVINLSGDGWYLWHDENAKWEEEDVLLSFEEARRFPVVSPTEGWDVLTSDKAMQVSVPGTAEEYLQAVPGPGGDIGGVSWWTRTIDCPEIGGGQKVFLKFESMRSRAEVFINHQLADYQIIDNVPFETDITSHVKSGEKIQLSVRITDAGGNHDWRDGEIIRWGDKRLPPGHGFGGITGEVIMEVRNPVYVTDIYMQNNPEITTVNAIMTLQNDNDIVERQDLHIIVYEWKNRNKVLFSKRIKGVTLHKGANEIRLPISAKNAKLWSIEDPNLYVCKVEVLNGREIVDSKSQRFGFRWFEASGVGENAIFRLNGRRIVLRSAISWGFWPVNGIFPSDELAERQIGIAKQLGLNMLNFHRFIGNSNVMDFADEKGLLCFEEPGGFRLDVRYPFMNSILHERVIRMVKRDRSHPCLIIYNMMNESGAAVSEKLEMEMQAMKDMHALDPSRYILRTSSWAEGDGMEFEEQAKIHLRPFDEKVYWNGWYDYHHAGGPAVWNESLYKGPDDYYNNTGNKSEIVFFGEEGALSSPPRLEKDREDLGDARYKGWDGLEYLRWYDEFNDYLDKKDLRGVYPTVDDLCIAMGTVSYEHQGRKIESARMNDITDAYVVNGWESELIENHSGIVDCFRYPKSDPAIIARYNQPLYVAVKPRQQIASAGESVTVDFYIINEKDIHGRHDLDVVITDSQGLSTKTGTYKVQITGGDVYGELLAGGIDVPVPATGGLCRIEANLSQGDISVASGHDDILSVNLSSNILEGKGAVWEDGDALRNFLKGRTKENVQIYTDSLDRLDWIIVTRPPKKEQLTMVPAEAFLTEKGSPGLDVCYYENPESPKDVYRETAGVINLSAIEGATPSPSVHMLYDYGIEWTGQILPPVSGEYTFMPQSNDRSLIKVTVNRKKIYEIANRGKHRGDGKIYLEGNKPADIEVQFIHPENNNARCRLDWAVPNGNMPDAQDLMERAINDGTKIFILQSADEWSEFIEANSNAIFKDKFFVGTNWLGGVMFNKSHPIFDELPAGGALNWPYQALIHTGMERAGFVMEGEELLVGAYHTYPMALGTAMGIVKMGKGSVLFSTLDIYSNIFNDDPAGLVAKKLIFNMIDFKQ